MDKNPKQSLPQTLVAFEACTFAWWNPDAPQDHSQRTVEDLNIVWDGLDLKLPGGVVSILGENGIGKSTLLHLAAGRLLPHQGRVTIAGIDSRDFATAPEHPEVEEERNRLCSLIYQNMELESELSLGALLEETLALGAWPARRTNGACPPGFVPGDLPEETCRAMDLMELRHRRLQQLSKGELQRGLMALAACYGSRLMVMDEPAFAMEEGHKQAAFGWFADFCRHSGTSLYFSAHDIDLCREHSDWMVLIFKDKSLKLGPTTEICTRENLEAAYRSPMDTLYRRQGLYRQMLKGQGSRQSADTSPPLPPGGL